MVIKTSIDFVQNTFLQKLSSYSTDIKNKKQKENMLNARRNAINHVSKKVEKYIQETADD